MALIRPSQHKSWHEVNEAIPEVTSATSATEAPPRPCEVGLELEQCRENEDCVGANDKSRGGVCRCKKGFRRAQDGSCQGINRLRFFSSYANS